MQGTSLETFAGVLQNRVGNALSAHEGGFVGRSGKIVGVGNELCFQKKIELLAVYRDAI